MAKLVRISSPTIVTKLRRLLGWIMQDPDPTEAYNCIMPVVDVTPLAGVQRTINAVFNGSVVAAGNTFKLANFTNGPPTGKRWIFLGMSVVISALGTSTSLISCGFTSDTSDVAQAGFTPWYVGSPGATTGQVNDTIGGILPFQNGFEMGTRFGLNVTMGATVGAPTVNINILVVEVDDT